MAVLPIITIPDPVLRKQAALIERVDAALLKLAEGMLAAMYEAPGIGLAAPQVGILRRLIVMDPSRDEETKQPLVMVNPVILERGSEMRTHEEGCLLISDLTAEIERPAMTRVSSSIRKGSNRSGRSKAFGRRWCNTRSII
jgi:peptide deformylase